MISTILINGEESGSGVPVTDSSVLRGDGCFEVIRSYGGRPHVLDLHLARLARSAATLGIDLPPEEALAGWVERVAADCRDCAIRVVVTRGSAVPDEPGEPLVIVFAHPWEPKEGPARLLPVRAPWHPAGIEWELAGAKVLSYASNLAAARKAQSEGYDDAVLLTNEGTILEGPTFSVAWVVDATLETPSLDLGILDSITRRLVLEDAARLGIPVVEGAWGLDRLELASELLAMSTVRQVQPVSRVGELAFPEGPVTSRLARAYLARVT